jgi:hypothetical protein
VRGGAAIAEALGAAATDGRPFAVTVEGASREVVGDGEAWVARLHLAPPPGASARRFVLRWESPVALETLVSVRRDFAAGDLDDGPTLLGILGHGETRLAVDREDGGAGRALGAAFGLGARHIAEGTDHLLFLLALLVPVPLLAAGRRWRTAPGAAAGVWRVLGVVTAFTLGHSLTLLVGAVGAVPIPVQLVEVAIAASILVSAVHAIRPIFPGREAWVAAAFGLVHGLAFAETLRGFDLDRATLLSTLAGFNLGIEAMQLAVVAAVVPWLVWMSRSPLYGAVRVVGASLAGVAACGWVAERSFALPNGVEPMVSAVAAHPLVALAALAAVAVTVAAMDRWTRERNALDVNA